MKEVEIENRDGTPILITRRTFRIPELENAAWLRNNPSGLLAAVLGGGTPPGLALALSDLTTAEIEAALVKAKGEPTT